MAEIVYDIFQDNKKSWKNHKDAEIILKNNTIVIDYNGPNKSAGIIKVIKTQPGKTYQIDINAVLSSGDIAFIHCETRSKPTEKLIPRIYFITNVLNDYTIEFIAKTPETVIGILFYNNNQKYELKITKMIVSSVVIEDDIYFTTIKQYKKILSKLPNKDGSLQKIINNNNNLVYNIITKS